MIEADKMFEQLGYEKEVRENLIVYINSHNGQDITFVISTQSVCADVGYECGHITMQELKAINKKVSELGWM